MKLVIVLFESKYRVPALCGFWDLKKTALCKICVSWTVCRRGSPSNAKIPHLCVHKPKIAVVGSAVVKTVQVGVPL